MPPTWVWEPSMDRTERGTVVLGGNNPPYKLPGATGNISGSQDQFAKDLSHCTIPYKSDNVKSMTYLNQRGRGGPLRSFMQLGIGDLGMVPGTRNNGFS